LVLGEKAQPDSYVRCTALRRTSDFRKN